MRVIRITVVLMRVSTISIHAMVAAPTLSAAPVPRGMTLRIDDLLPDSAYDRSRQAHRQRMIAYRRARTVALGTTDTPTPFVTFRPSRYRTDPVGAYESAT